MASAGPPPCNNSDYDALAAMDIPTIAYCVYDNSGVWDTCLATLALGEGCLTQLTGNYDDTGATTCSTPCTDPASVDCGICQGVVNVQETAILAPIGTGPCANDLRRKVGS